MIGPVIDMTTPALGVPPPPAVVVLLCLVVAVVIVAVVGRWAVIPIRGTGHLGSNRHPARKGGLPLYHRSYNHFYRTQASATASSAPSLSVSPVSSAAAAAANARLDTVRYRLPLSLSSLKSNQKNNRMVRMCESKRQRMIPEVGGGSRSPHRSWRAFALTNHHLKAVQHEPQKALLSLTTHFTK